MQKKKLMPAENNAFLANVVTEWRHNNSNPAIVD